MKVSVIIPAHNAEKFLAEAVSSVRAQTWSGEVEIVVCDDGSTDGTADIVRSLEGVILVSHQQSRGISAARNRAVQESSGDHIAFLDADDLWRPTKLEQQLAVLDSAKEPGLVFGLSQEFDENGPRDDYRPNCLPSSCLMPRTVWEKVGEFDEQMKLAEFSEWLTRAKDKGVPFLTPAIEVAQRRIHGDNIGIRERDNRRAYLEVARRHLARRRGQTSGD